MGFIVNLLITALSAFVLGKYVLPGVHIDDFGAAIIFSLILGIVSAIIKPILVILTIPITILTLGLFYLVINALMIMLAAHFVGGIHIEDIWWAIAFSVLLSIVSSVISSFVGTK